MAPLRILVLPGYTQNAKILGKKYGALRKAIAPAEMVFVDPTHVVHLPTDSSADFDSTATANATTEEETPRAWWFAEQKDGYRHFSQFDETVVYLRKILETQGPFDACWGFSQGAALSAILAALVERPEMSPEFARPGENWPPKQFKFCVSVAGFLPADQNVAKFFAKNCSTPSLHVLGRGDTIVGEDRSLPLVSVFDNPRVEWHDGGHHTPSKASWRKFFKAYVEAFEGENGAIESRSVLSPDGTATPESGKL